MVNFYIGAVWTKIYGLSYDQKEKFKQHLQFRPKDYIFSKKFQEGKWDGWVKLFMDKSNFCLIYSGLVSKFIKLLNFYNIEYNYKKNYNNNTQINDVNLEGIELRNYQKDIVEVCKSKKRGIIKAPTGSGKTECFIKLAADIPVKTLIVVNRTTLFQQIKQKIQTRLNISEKEINYIFGEEKYYNPKNRITISTFQSLISKEKKLTKGKYGGMIKKSKLKWEKILKDFEMVIVDETHHLSMNELGMLMKTSNKTLFRYGFSATPFREDGYDMMLEAIIGPQIYNLKLSTLIQKKYLSKPKIYLLKNPYYIDKPLSFKASYEKLMMDKERNKIISKISYKFGIKGKTVLISFLRLDHLQQIYDYLEEMNEASLTIKIITGRNTSKQKEEALNKMNEGEYNIVLSTLFGEGVDIPNLDVLVNCKSIKSKIDTYQQIGRVLRMVKGKSPIVIDFFDYNKYITDNNLTQKDMKDYFKSFSKKRLKILKSEPEFDLREIDNIDEIEEI